MRLRLRDFLALATVGYLLSVMHKILTPGFYTDYMALYYRSVLPTNNGIPYHAYWLEYPAIPAILIWVSGLTSTFQLYMATMAFLMFPFVIGTVYFLYRTSVEFGGDKGRIITFFILAPSFLVFSFYNWDMAAAFFATAAIYYSLKRRSRLTGLLLGLGTSAKIYPVLLLPVFMKEARSWRDRFDMFLSAVIGAILPNLPFILVDFPAWFSSNTWTRQVVYLEESIWSVIGAYRLMPEDWLVNAVVWSLIILVIFHVTFSNQRFELKLWSILAAFILIYPTYPPQFDLWLLPLFVLNPVFSLIPFLAFDFFNSAIILSWFSVADPFQPWGAVWDLSLVRIGLLVLMLTLGTRTRHGEGALASLASRGDS